MTDIDHRYGPIAATFAHASRVGGRAANADAVAVEANPLGLGAAVIDGIGSSPAVVAAARRAADIAAAVAAHRGAQAGIMAAADTMPYYPGGPNAVGAVVSLEPGGRIEIAHVGDCAVWTWSAEVGLRRWTVDQTAGQHVTHMLTNPGLPDLDRAALANHGDRIVSALGAYVLNGLAFATVSTISWTPLRGPEGVPDLIILTSDGVHKLLGVAEIGELVGRHAGDPQILVDALVDAAAAGSSDPDDSADNVTAAVVKLRRSEV